MKIVCRCQDVTEEEVIDAIRQGATTIDEVKRLVRAGMGPCQGRTCRRLVSQILSRELKKPIPDIYPPTFRPPNIPVQFSLIMAELKRQEEQEKKKSSRSKGGKSA
jgi:NAD(P)H-nitrite reductase large subunit